VAVDAGELNMLEDIDSVNHVGIAVRNLPQAVERYEALGFTMTPLSVHSGSAKPGERVAAMATGNQCIMFPNNYVEVLGIVNPGRPDWGVGDAIKRFQGAHIICFGCQKAEAVHRRLSEAGIKTSGVIALQRDVETEAGVLTARFDCVHFDRSATPEGFIQAAHHRNPEYIHQPRYMSHKNGAQALSDLVLLVTEPESYANKYQQLTGQKARRDGKRWWIELPLVSRLTFICPNDIGAELPGSLFPPTPSIAGIGFSVADPGHVANLLKSAGIQHAQMDDRVVVPAEEALGVALYFAAS
jgi:hypothetical protein